MNVELSTQGIYYVLTFQAVLMILVRYPESYAYLYQRLRRKLAGAKTKRFIKRAIGTKKKLGKYQIIDLKKLE